jgi:dTDP-4-amino-4,6-dideoxy-D-galactose acyltransferase
MELKMLDWDSNFWRKRIFSLHMNSFDSFEEAQKIANESDADLVYIFTDKNAYAIPQLESEKAITLLDNKLTFSMELNLMDLSYNQEVNDETSFPDINFLKLARSAGKHSRFYLDNNLSQQFDHLYDMWLVNSLNKSLADKTFVIKNEDQQVVSFLTSKIKNERGSIGLIATNEKYMGRGYGSKLITHLHKWYLENNIKFSDVITQKSNVQACAFYSKLGFSVIKEELVYHWWRN